MEVTYLRLGRCYLCSRRCRSRAKTRRQGSRERCSSPGLASHSVRGGAAVAAKPNVERRALNYRRTGTCRGRRVSSGRTPGTAGRTGRRRSRGGHKLGEWSNGNGESSQGPALIHPPLTVGWQRVVGCNIYPSDAIGGG